MAAEPDRTGFDETTNYLSEALGRLVPQSLARRAIGVSVSTDRQEYAPGEPIEIEIVFRNRLPVPVTIHTPRQRLWGWSVDGTLEASDEPRYMSTQQASMTFRGRERKRVRRSWNGKVRRSGTPDTWEPLSPGAHEIRAFIALEGPRPEARTEIRVT